MKFYSSPFLMPVGIIGFTVASMVTNGVPPPPKASPAQDGVTVQYQPKKATWFAPADHAQMTDDLTAPFPFIEAVDYGPRDTVVSVDLPSI